MSVKRFVIVGASGNVGRQLVPLLAKQGIDLVLIGRDPAKLRDIFPTFAIGGYEALEESGGEDATLLFLAAINNDKKVDYEQFELVNETLAIKTQEKAEIYGYDRFLYFSSIHALDQTNQSAYARSKRRAAQRLKQTSRLDTRVLFLPAVIGETLTGRLALLNRLPKKMSRVLLTFLRSLKPTVDIECLAEYLCNIDLLPSEYELIITTDQSGNVFYESIKRLIDITGSLAILCAIWWLLLAIWLTVKLGSPGPGLLKQTRVGRRGKPFTCLKFRTMYVSAPIVATHEVPEAAITRFGKILRRTKLDELPQLFNILKNDMSFVGPRPCLPVQRDIIEQRNRRGILTMKPGITGLAQVNNIDMSEVAELVAFDERYMKVRSVLLDVKMIFYTFLGRGSGDRVRAKG